MERIVVPELVRLQGYSKCVALNSRGEFYANPRALIDLESSVARPWDYIVYERLDTMRFALHFVPKKIDGAVHVRRSKSKTTALFGAGPVLALIPAMRVGPGRILDVPYRLEPQEGEHPSFVIEVSVRDNRPAAERKRTPKPAE